MSSKMTELTVSSPLIPPPSILCGSGIFHQLGSPWSMASSGHFDPSQIYDGYKAVEVLDPSCTEFLRKRKKCFLPYIPQSSKCHHYFVGKKPCKGPGDLIANAPTPGANSGYSNLPGSRKGMWEGGLILEGLFLLLVGQFIPAQTSSSPESTAKVWLKDSEELTIHPPTSMLKVVINCMVKKIFHRQGISSTPRSVQPIIYTIPSSIPPPSPNPSTARTALVSLVRLSPIPQPRNSSMVTSHKLKPVASSIR
ncbi:hypothetical protein O181_025048 [Austropuccinia psidii MF-1]|uniref:Uncharacterized protein n=1 Tax=Austropuccinia psidii MF-1 TaxID=1389203 RepID=A0A9Q3GYR7_9BASI|nr:hypothetical protein [Austropuccinia psidii MF-1]